MIKKFSYDERKTYVCDKLKQLKEPLESLAEICKLQADEVAMFLSGENKIEDKNWVQLGLGLTRLAKKKGVLTEKEEKSSGQPIIKKVSRTSIIRRVESLDVFKENTQ